ncbi:L-serine dehydratase [Candidatus Thermokryptus mobilis]|uniref:L-serine dehydratase n=1 Tax=Candidatus Thermokryptus mobilis TaxID=1643428 RepID=A0A0S4N9G3_9BACT|nr:L-serine ammonia-lyase, iron-sulfur-dependent subunit beta [Candidatus Thermokryptus mobilis]CUU07632.1 L-serine dehydratase [Candidatus Thermokryptus mobilis]
MPSIFDILGPVMIGPSSSHTAGAAKLGLIARQLLGTEPVKAEITLYNSFARTYKGHGTDRAIVGGILGMRPDDERLRNSLEMAKEKGLKYEFKLIMKAPKLHPNSARIKLFDKDGNKIEMVGSSLGGGRIEVVEIEGFKVSFSVMTHTIVIIADDIPGSIAHISGAIAEKNINIANMFVSREEKLANMVIEVDQEVPNEVLQKISSFSWVHYVRLVEPIV